MLEAVFISDLHLSPSQPAISNRFYQCVHWISTHTRSLYILGDLFDAWPGDDNIDAFSQPIIDALKQLSDKGVKLYFMSGNRDFLLGKGFMQACGMQYLKDPCIVFFDKKPVLLSHGDKYCTKDKGHQWLRRLTRNALFPILFQLLPLSTRQKFVGKVRTFSQQKSKSMIVMDTVEASLIRVMKAMKTTTIIHGHTHKPGLRQMTEKNQVYTQYVLSDWDDLPLLLCYHKSIGFHFVKNFSGDCNA